MIVVPKRLGSGGRISDLRLGSYFLYQDKVFRVVKVEGGVGQYGLDIRTQVVNTFHPNTRVVRLEEEPVLPEPVVLAMVTPGSLCVLADNPGKGRYLTGLLTEPDDLYVQFTNVGSGLQEKEATSTRVIVVPAHVQLEKVVG